MAQATIKLKDGTLIEISGSIDEIKKVLELYPSPINAISTDGLDSETKQSPSAGVSKIEKALGWAHSQIGRPVQPCVTVGCKYFYEQPGEIPCTTPDPAADPDEVGKGNHDSLHPLWHFYCMRFVRTSYEMPPEYEKAENMCQAMIKNGWLKTEESIPVGALVFWHWTTFGHIGIYSGDGKVVHTGVKASLKMNGVRESLLQDITDVLGEESYAGWAYPPENWLK